MNIHSSTMEHRPTHDLRNDIYLITKSYQSLSVERAKVGAFFSGAQYTTASTPCWRTQYRGLTGVWGGRTPRKVSAAHHSSRDRISLICDHRSRSSGWASMLCILRTVQGVDWQCTPCPKKPSRFVFVRTSSNFHLFWKFLAERWQTIQIYARCTHFPLHLICVTTLPC